MIKKSNIIEIILILTLAFELILKNFDFKTDYFLYANLIFLNIFWIIQNKIFNTKIKKSIIIEKEIISITLWAIVMNLCKVKSSYVLFQISLLILSILFLIKFIRNRKIATNWLKKQEPLVLSLIFLSFFIQYMHYQGSGILRILSFSYYIVIVIIFSISNNIKKNNTEQRLLRIMNLLSNISISIMLISILFRTMFWHNSRMIFWFSLILSFIFGYWLFIGYIKNKKEIIIISQTLKRLFITVVISIILFSYFTVNYSRLDFGNRPELINNYIECRFNKHYDRNSTSCERFEELYEDFRNGRIPEKDE